MKTTAFTLLTCTVLIGVLLCGCRSNPGQELPAAVITAQQENTQINSKLVEADNSFGLTLFHNLVKDDLTKNIFISPTSIALALQMVYNGASGETRQAMEKTMALQGLSMEEVNEGNAALLANLTRPDPGMELHIGDGIWLRHGISVQPDFIQRNRAFYGAEIGDLDGAPDNINAWVSQKTRGEIPSILQPSDISSSSFAVLVNVIYFKGKWQDAFNSRATQEQPFTLLNGSKQLCKMMQLTHKDHDYYACSDFQAITLPYQGQQYSMVIILPGEKTSLPALLARLTPETWRQWMGKLSRVVVDLQLPRFRTEYTADLNSVLKTSGMGIAFDVQQADFRGMVEDRVCIDQVWHKTHVNVDEEETEAVAVTHVKTVTTEGPLPLHMEVNRPFLYAIRENQSGALLFLGVMVEPKQ